MKAEFPIGARVELKSGGPDMTVNTYVTDNGITFAKCCWFDNDDHYHCAIFHWKVLINIDKGRE